MCHEFFFSKKKKKFGLLRGMCGYCDSILLFLCKTFCYGFCVEFRAHCLCEHSGWRDVIRAARLACLETGVIASSISV